MCDFKHVTRSVAKRGAQNSAEANGRGPWQPAKRQKVEAQRRTHRAPSKRDANPFADLVGKTVDIPAEVFNVDIPDLLYRGRVMGRDAHRKGAVVVKFEEDGTRYWLPADDVRGWLQEMEASGRTERDATIGTGADEFAASVLTEFLQEKHRSSCSNSATSCSSHGKGSIAGGMRRQQRSLESRSLHQPLHMAVDRQHSSAGTRDGMEAPPAGPGSDPEHARQPSLGSCPEQEPQSCCSHGASLRSLGGREVVGCQLGQAEEAVHSCSTSHNLSACL